MIMIGGVEKKKEEEAVEEEILLLIAMTGIFGLLLEQRHALDPS